MSDDLRWHLLISKSYELKIAKAFRLLRSRNIEPILIKGWAAARNYPTDVPRYFSDIDLAVSPSDYPAALKLINSNEFGGLGIDLHEGLRHLDTNSWERLFEDSQIKEIDGTAIRILSSEDHFRVLCVHWLNDGGAYRERLWDIYYAVANRPPEFDWDKCLNVVSETRRRWIVCAIGLAHRYLELDINGLPFAEEAEQLPDWLIKTVEKEWMSDVRLRPLQTCLREPRELIRQIRKRFPPNPIQATIEVEGEFDNRTRAFYQFHDLFKRSVPSIRRITSVLFRK